MNKAMQSQETIVRATQDIKKGEEISTDKITNIKVGGYNLPEQIIKEQSQVVGKYATADIYKDDYFLQSKVTNSISDDMENTQDGNMVVAITIRSLAAGLSGKIKAGDIISIISSSEDGSKPIIIPELQYVEVLSSTSKEGIDIKGKQEDLPSTINLSVESIQAEKLVEQEQYGDIHIALAYRGNDNTREEYLEIQRQYLLSLEKGEEDIDGEIEEFEVTQDEETRKEQEDFQDETEGQP